MGPHADFSGTTVTKVSIDAKDPKVLHVTLHTVNHGLLTGTPICEADARTGGHDATTSVTGHPALPHESQDVTLNLVFDVPIDPQSFTVTREITHCNAK